MKLTVKKSPHERTPLSRRMRMFGIATGAALLISAGVIASPAAALSGDLRMHDPSVIKQGSCFFGYATGIGGGPGNGAIQIRKTCDSTGRTGWTYIGTVWNSVPAWITTRLGQVPPSIWAPDINYMNGKYYLYYAASIWGQTSLAVTGVMTATNPAGPWTDQGQVTDQNYPLDPNLAWSGSTPYLFTGSFGGVWVRQIDPTTGKFAAGSTAVKVATKMENASIIYNGGYYYLFGSKGGCCNGTASTYYSVISRSTSLTGPYTDKSGVAMTSAGGTKILDAGGGDVYQDGTAYKFAYHYYDPNNNGLERLDIRPITFASGWPVLGSPIGP